MKKLLTLLFAIALTFSMTSFAQEAAGSSDAGAAQTKAEKKEAKKKAKAAKKSSKKAKKDAASEKTTQ